MTTVVAFVRLIPSPPAFVETKNTWKAKDCALSGSEIVVKRRPLLTSDFLLELYEAVSLCMAK